MTTLSLSISSVSALMKSKTINALNRSLLVLTNEPISTCRESNPDIVEAMNDQIQNVRLFKESIVLLPERIVLWHVMLALLNTSVVECFSAALSAVSSQRQLLIHLYFAISGIRRELLFRSWTGTGVKNRAFSSTANLSCPVRFEGIQLLFPNLTSGRIIFEIFKGIRIDSELEILS